MTKPHDGAQQRLTALTIRLGAATHAARQEPELAAAIDRARTELGLAIDDVRALAHGLHPAVLTNFGLNKAIQGAATRSTIPIEVVALPATRPEPAAEAAAYYVFAEAVTNADRHAQASRIRVRVAQEGSILRIEITDDGIGGADERAGLGLQGLRDRVETIGGTFAIHGPPGRGTRIAAAIPAQGPATRDTATGAPAPNRASDRSP